MGLVGKMIYFSFRDTLMQLNPSLKALPIESMLGSSLFGLRRLLQPVITTFFVTSFGLDRNVSAKKVCHVLCCNHLDIEIAALLFWMNMDPVLAEEVSTQSNSENGKDTYYDVSLSRVEDGLVVSNVHTTKWRIFTDNGRDYFLQASFSFRVLL